MTGSNTTSNPMSNFAASATKQLSSMMGSTNSSAKTMSGGRHSRMAGGKRGRKGRRGTKSTKKHRKRSHHKRRKMLNFGLF